MNQLLAIMVALPLFVAPIIVCIPRRMGAWLMTFVTLCVVLTLAILVAAGVVDKGFLDVDMGNWAPPFGIEYRADGLNAAVLILIAAMAIIVMPFAMPHYLEEVAPEKQPVCYAIFLLCVTGLLGMTITHDIFNIYVFLEIASLATYVLIALGKSKQSTIAAFDYLILGSIGATFFLIGIGFIYMATGTLNLTDIAIALRSQGEATPLVITALSCMVVGLLMKAAVFPMHLWMVQSYVHAPTIFAAFFSATATKVSLYLLIRIVYGVFGWSLLPAHVIMILAVGAIIVGSVAALRQQSIKRMLAYSSVAQIGYMVFAISLGTSAGLAAALLHLLMHAPAKAGLFLCAAVVERQRGGDSLSHFKGMGKKMPMMAFAFVICGLSLIGIPLTAGFLSKWLLLSSLIQAGQWLGLVLLLVSGLFAVVYIGKVLEAMFYQTESEVAVHKGDASWMLTLPLVLLAAICIYFGLFSEDSMQMVQKATNLYFRAGE